MSVTVLNPDSTVLQQLQGHWQTIASILVWKLAPGENGVRVTAADMQAYADAVAKGEVVLYTHGHKDSIDFRIVTKEAAQRLTAHDRATNRGRA